MSEEMDSSDAVFLSDFLSERYPLFALLGIFGALVVYLNQLSNQYRNTASEFDTNPFIIGEISSSILFLLVLYLLLDDIITELDKSQDSIEVRKIVLLWPNIFKSIILVIFNFVIQDKEDIKLKNVVKYSILLIAILGVSTPILIIPLTEWAEFLAIADFILLFLILTISGRLAIDLNPSGWIFLPMLLIIGVINPFWEYVLQLERTYLRGTLAFTSLSLYFSIVVLLSATTERILRRILSIIITVKDYISEYV